MKNFLNSRKIGDVVMAEVVEATGGTYFIVNFEGDLIRLANHSPLKFRPGQKVELIVTAVNPFSFRLSQSGVNRLDRTV